MKFHEAQKKAGLTLRELSKVTGIDAVTLSDIKLFRQVPEKEYIEKISKAFGTTDWEYETNQKKAFDKWCKERLHLEQLMDAIGQIKDKHGKTNARGHIICPKCGKNLYYTVAALNGHTWGKCETKDCLSWME